MPQETLRTLLLRRVARDSRRENHAAFAASVRTGASTRDAARCATTVLACIAALSDPRALKAQETTAAGGKTASGKWSATIVALSGTNMRGAADLRVESRNDKESRARLAIRSVPINRQLAWDIVAGSCGDEGRPVAAAAAFRVLLSRNDGGGDTMANIPKLVAGQRYYVRVFAQGEQGSDKTSFGCANLSEEL